MESLNTCFYFHNKKGPLMYSADLFKAETAFQARISNDIRLTK